MQRYADRSLHLRHMLDEGRTPSLHEICHHLNITSERHARRLIRQLRDQGVPVQEQRDGRTKRFYLPPEHRQARLQDFAFNEEEMLALAVAAEAAKAALTDTPLEDPLDRAFRKLLEKLAPEAYTFEMEEQSARWHFGSQAASPVDPQVFQTLQRAASENRSVRIDYHTASTGSFSRNRKIDPLQLARHGGAWIVIAWCHERREPRDFALAGIEHAAPCDPEHEIAFFSPPDGFDPKTYFRNRFGALDGDRLYTVRLLVEADRAPYFRRKRYHPSQHIEKQADGRLLVSYRVAGLNEIRSFAQSWGVGVTVREPPELVAMMSDEADALARRYAEMKR